MPPVAFRIRPPCRSRRSADCTSPLPPRRAGQARSSRCCARSTSARARSSSRAASRACFSASASAAFASRSRSRASRLRCSAAFRSGFGFCSIAWPAPPSSRPASASGPASGGRGRCPGRGRSRTRPGPRAGGRARAAARARDRATPPAASASPCRPWRRSACAGAGRAGRGRAQIRCSLIASFRSAPFLPVTAASCACRSRFPDCTSARTSDGSSCTSSFRAPAATEGFGSAATAAASSGSLFLSSFARALRAAVNCDSGSP